MLSSSSRSATNACQAALSRPLVFIHGWWGGSWVWGSFIECFRINGFHCIAVDLSGTSGTESPEMVGKICMEDHLAEVRAVVQKLDQPILIGHSFGGLLIQKLAEEMDLHAAVLLGPAAPRGILALRSWALFWHAIRIAPQMLRRKAFMPAQSDMIRLNLNRLSIQQRELVLSKMVPASGTQAFEAAVVGISVDERRVHTPMLVVAGGDDRLTPPAVGKAIAKKFGAEYREYPENGHYVMREDNYQQIAADIQRWICKTVGS